MTNSSETKEPSTESSSSVVHMNRGPIWRRTWLWAVLAGAAAITVAGVYLPGKGSGFATGAPAKPSASFASSATSQPPAAVPTRSVPPARTPEQLATSGHLSPKLKIALRRWNVGIGGRAFAAVSNDLGTALQAGGVKLYSTMRSACVSLASAVDTAKSGPPIPDRATQARYAAALAGLATAAADCHAAITERASGDETLRTEENPTRFRRAEIELGAGTRNLYVVTEEIAAAGRR
jgi:hypothetical protein